MAAITADAAKNTNKITDLGKQESLEIANAVEVFDGGIVSLAARNMLRAQAVAAWSIIWARSARFR